MRILTIGEMAEWSIAAVLKTVEGHTSGGSNPSLSAVKPGYQAFVVYTPDFTHLYLFGLVLSGVYQAGTKPF